MIRFEPPTRETLYPFLKMELTPDQTAARLVAPNPVTLAQAAYDPASEVYGIWDGDVPVGLLALVDQNHPEFELEDGDDPNALYIWRILIDKGHQRKGYGTAALDFSRKRAKALGRPKLLISAVPHKLSAQPVYEAFGFRATGRVSDGEAELAYEI